VWTLKDLWENYRASPEFARCTRATRSVVGSVFNAHILPRIGNAPISSIDVPTARRLMHAVTSDNRHYRRGIRLGGAGAARKVARTLSAALSWAVGAGQLERNPLKGSLRIGSDGTREVTITEPQQYARLFATMDRMVDAGEIRAAVKAFVVTAALTGARRSELQQLTWGQVDLAARRLVLTDTKGVKLAKRGGIRTETLSLPPLAAAALSAIRPGEAKDDALDSTWASRRQIESHNWYYSPELKWQANRWYVG
jgi:integrase